MTTLAIEGSSHTCNASTKYVRPLPLDLRFPFDLNNCGLSGLIRLISYSGNSISVTNAVGLQGQYLSCFEDGSIGCYLRSSFALEHLASWHHRGPRLI